MERINVNVLGNKDCTDDHGYEQEQGDIFISNPEGINDADKNPAEAFFRNTDELHSGGNMYSLPAFLRICSFDIYAFMFKDKSGYLCINYYLQHDGQTTNFPLSAASRLCKSANG